MKTIKILILSMVFLSTAISVAQKTWSNNRYTFNNDGGGDKMYLNIDDNTAHSVEFTVGSGIDRMYFRAPNFQFDGHVGVAHDLDVSAELNVNGTINANGALKFSKTLRQMLNLWDHRYGIGIQNQTQYFRTSFNFAWYKGGVHSDIKLDPGGGTALMVLNQDGRLGVGISNPSEKLEVNGNIKTSGHLAIGNNGFFGYNFDGSNNIYSLGFSAQDNVILNIGDETLTESDFNVFDGVFDDAIIGTFELDSPIPNGAFFSHSMMNEANYAIAQDNTGDTYLNAGSGAPINFLVGNALKMKLHSNGNLGIGTGRSYVPSEKLEVNGNITTQHTTMGTFGSSMPSGAYFANKVMSTDTNYALAQDANGDTYLNAKAEAPINFLLGNVLKMKLYTNGNLGIGTGASYVPSEKLEVNGNMKSLGMQINTTRKDALTIRTTDNLQSNGIAFQNSGNAYTWNIFREDVGSNYADLVFASGLEFEVSDLNEKFRITTNGKVGIGIDIPVEKLEVNGNAKALGIILSGDGANTNTIDSNIDGTIVFGGEDGSTLTDAQIADSFYPDFSVWVEEGIVTEDIAVAPSSEWDGSQPDYVFETDYELPSLEDVEVYVTSYKHLEGIPSKAEVAEKGWSLPGMDQKLLKKIEELTLYTIRQEKEIKALRALVEKLVEVKN